MEQTKFHGTLMSNVEPKNITVPTGTRYILCQAEGCCAIVCAHGLGAVRDYAKDLGWRFIGGGKFLCTYCKEKQVLLRIT